MFGLTFEKLLVITIFAGFVVGPQRLPIYAHRLADFVRDLRAFLETTRARAEGDLGVPLRQSEWQIDLRDYDPRRIVRDALADAPASTDSAERRTQARSAHGTAAPEATITAKPATRQRWIVAGGTSGHPRRILITEPIPEHRLPEALDTPAPATVAGDAPATIVGPVAATVPPDNPTVGCGEQGDSPT